MNGPICIALSAYSLLLPGGQDEGLEAMIYVIIPRYIKTGRRLGE